MYFEYSFMCKILFMNRFDFNFNKASINHDIILLCVKLTCTVAFPNSRYTPSQQGVAFNSGAKQRIIRMVEAQKDPMEPPKFKYISFIIFLNLTFSSRISQCNYGLLHLSIWGLSPRSVIHRYSTYSDVIYILKCVYPQSEQEDSPWTSISSSTCDALAQQKGLQLSLSGQFGN